MPKNQGESDFLSELNSTSSKQEAESKLSLAAALVLFVLGFLFIIIGASFGILSSVFLIVSSAINVLLLTCLEPKASAILAILLNAAAFIGTLFLNSSVLIALNSLFPIVMALPVWFALTKKKGRSFAIVGAAVFGTLYYVIIFALSIFFAYGKINSEIIELTFNTIFEPISEALQELSYEFEDKTLFYFTKEQVEQFIYITKTMIIGVLSASMLCASYFVTLAVRLIAKLVKTDFVIPKSIRVNIFAVIKNGKREISVVQNEVPWCIVVDNITVIVYVIAYLGTFLFGSFGKGTLLAYILVNNLVIILSPAFFYCGARDLLLKYKAKALGAFGKIIPLLVVLMLFVNFQALFSIVCIFGVFAAIGENRMRKGKI